MTCPARLIWHGCTVCKHSYANGNGSAGRWSVDMFAMFHLGHMDVLPVGDLGVRNGMKTLYGLKVGGLAQPPSRESPLAKRDWKD